MLICTHNLKEQQIKSVTISMSEIVDKKVTLTKPKSKGRAALQSLANKKTLKAAKTKMDVDETNDIGAESTTPKLARVDDNANEPMDTNENDNNISQAASTSSRMSLTSTKIKKESIASSTLPEELQTLLSGMYLDVTKRLCMNTPLRCATDLAFCHNNHYRTAKPEAPFHTQVINLRCTYQQARYVEFIHLVWDMCVRSEFPGEGVFTKLIELILCTNYQRKESTSPRQAYVSIQRLFRTVVNAFPPCWLAMRPHYINFFRQGLDMKKLILKTKQIITTSNKIMGIIFDLIEYTFKNYEEIIDNESEVNMESSQNSMLLETSSMKSQCFNQWNWDEDTDMTAFCNLKTDSRLERINVVIGLLLHILETDLCMWILHHHRDPKEFMFHEEKAPLVILVFDMSQNQRSTRLVRKLFEIFSKGMALGLNTTHLKLVERMISLIMVASHTADLEDSVIGIRYPTLKPKTRELIKDFFRYFKVDNRSSLKTYLTCIDLLRIPYVKYEFIDLFLQMFHHPSNDPITPNKIAHVIFRNYWSKYKPESEQTNSEEELSREQYFELLLKALRAYSDMHGLETIFRFLFAFEKISPLQTVTDSIHHYPNRGDSSNKILLNEMITDKQQWLSQLRLEVRMSRPKVNLPPANICIDKEVIASYRSDLKYCTLLAEIMHKHAQAHGTNDIVQQLLEFSSKFKL